MSKESELARADPRGRTEAQRSAGEEATHERWTCERQDGDGGDVNAGDDVYSDIYWAIHDATTYEFIANVHSNEKHARLIASAPDLLSIVQRWAALDGGAWHVERHASEKAELLTDTRAAINRATKG